MYGCYDADYVYGIQDIQNSDELIFDEEEIEELGLQVYGLSVIKHHLCDPIYGIPVSKKATKEQKEIVKKAYDYLKKNYKNTQKLKLGYYLVIKGYDWEIKHDLYENIDDVKNNVLKEKRCKEKIAIQELDKKLLNYAMYNNIFNNKSN